MLLPFLICCGTALALLALALILHQTKAGPLSRPEPVTSAALIYAVLITVPLLMTGFTYMAGKMLATRDFRMLETWPQPVSYDRNGYEVYVNALDGVSIAAGIERPDMRLLDDPGLNALTYQDRYGQKIIMLTAGALVSDMGTEQKNAIIAHEVSHIVMGDVLRKPGPFSVEFLPDFFQVLLIAIGGLTFALPGFDAMRLMLGFVIAAAVLSLCILGRSRRFAVEQRALAYHHDDILADTIAAKLTNNPKALMEAIQMSEADMIRRGMQDAPGGLIAAYLFAGPKSLSDRELRRLMGMDAPVFSAESTEEPGSCDTNIIERLANLSVIDQGLRPPVEAWMSTD